MSTSVVDLALPQKQTRADQPGFIPNLGMLLAQLIGKPFLFARLGHADELSLHFGIAKPADHPRLRAKGIQYGSHILSVCASAWILNSTPKLRLLLDGVIAGPIAHLTKGPLLGDNRREIAEGGLIAPGSRVVSAIPYEVEQVQAIGLEVETADGSGLGIIPNAIALGENIADESIEETPLVDDLPPGTPELADWELRTPKGIAKVGPGRAWSWEPSRASH